MLILVLACLVGALTGTEPHYRVLFKRLNNSDVRLPSTTKFLALVGMAGTIPGIATLAAIGGIWAGRGSEFDRFAAISVLIVLGFILLSRRSAGWMSQRISRHGDGLIPFMSKDGKRSVFASLLFGNAVGMNWLPYAAPVLGLTLASTALDGPNIQLGLLIAAYAFGATAGGSLAALTMAVSPVHIIPKIGKRVGQTMGVAVLSGTAAISARYDTGLVTGLSFATTINLEREIDVDVRAEKRPGAGIFHDVERPEGK